MYTKKIGKIKFPDQTVDKALFWQGFAIVRAAFLI